MDSTLIELRYEGAGYCRDVTDVILPLRIQRLLVKSSRLGIPENSILNKF
jgi:hypothetical protein